MTLLDPTNAVWNLSESVGTERVVLLALAHHADPDGYCWPGLERIASMARVGTRATQTALAKLIEAEELAVLRGRGRGHASLYRVVLGQPEGASDPEVMLAWLRSKTTPFLADLYKKVQQTAPFDGGRKGAGHDTVTRRNSAAHGQEKVQSAAPKPSRIWNELPEEHQNSTGSPDGHRDNPSGQGQDLPDGSMGSHGSPSPHGGAPPPPSQEQNGHKPELAGNGPEAAEALNAGVLVGEYLAACRVRPPSRFVGHLARETRTLVDEGIAADYIRAGLTTVRKRGLSPSALPSAVAQAMNADPPRTNGRPPTTNGNGNGHHASDEEAALRAAREFNARQEARRRAATTTARGARLAVELAARGVSQ